MTRDEQIEQAAKRTAETKRTAEAAAQCEYDFVMGAEWADSHPDWRSVEDELPKTEGLYLVHNGECVIADWFGDGWGVYNVTHWMPLPQPPKKGGEK